jgi:hypothetical protein
MRPPAYPRLLRASGNHRFTLEIAVEKRREHHGAIGIDGER